MGPMGPTGLEGPNVPIRLKGTIGDIVKYKIEVLIFKYVNKKPSSLKTKI